MTRMIREMQVAKPQALFFNGDMIYGYSSNKEKMDRYYAYWRGMMSNLIESGTYVVPIPGNHEVQHQGHERGTRRAAVCGHSS